MSAETMIERVARALAEHEVPGLWDRMETESQDVFRAKARVAIEAMREPTAKMCAAAASAMSPGLRPTMGRVSNREKHAIRYRAMIDTALGQEIDAKLNAALTSPLALDGREERS